MRPYKSALIEELGKTCTLKTVRAFKASTSRYVPFRPLRICLMLRATSSGIVESSARTGSFDGAYSGFFRLGPRYFE